MTEVHAQTHTHGHGGGDHDHDHHNDGPAPKVTLTPEVRRTWEKRAKLLAMITLAYNCVEAIVALFAGSQAGSQALISFGGDAVVEAMSATVVIWQFSGVPEERERRALKLIGFAFLALAVYVTIDSVRSLITGSEAEVSRLGIGLTILSLIVMPNIVIAKRRAGRALGSGTVMADSMQTLLCTTLSAIVLAGLLLNATLGWAWADPIAALFVAGLAAKEGVDALRGKHCAH
jgi:divalent metal cation (Fe/Co/Zn/Cd) transporter